MRWPTVYSVLRPNRPARPRSDLLAVTDAAIRARIVEICRARGPDKTCCPSDIARGLADDWRGLMPRVRGQAGRLAGEGQIEIRQNGRAVDIATARGPIRLALAKH